MSIFTKLGVSVAAPFNADGTPRQISPQDFQIWMTEIERLIKGLIAGAGGFELPELIYKYVITGGNQNNITAKPNAEVTAGAGEALFTIDITQANTGDVRINGKPLLTSSGNQIVAGGLVPGIWLFLDDGANFRLVSDQSSQAIMNAAEQAATAAQASRDIVESLASDAVSQGNVPIYSTLAAIASLEIPAGINAIRVNGRNSIGDGEGGLYISADNGSGDTGVSGDGRSWWRVEDVGSARLSQEIRHVIERKPSGVVIKHIRKEPENPDLIYDFITVTNPKWDTVRKEFAPGVASDGVVTKISAREFCHQTGSTIAINVDGWRNADGSSGFEKPLARPNGLVISNGILYQDWLPDETRTQALVVMSDGTWREANKNDGISGAQWVSNGAVWSACWGMFCVRDGVAVDLAGSYVSNVVSARTIIGKRSNGDIIVVLIEGKSDLYGATPTRCGQLMAYLGCDVAYICDGGGSSQCWWKNAYAMPSSDVSGSYLVERGVPTFIVIDADTAPEDYDSGFINIPVVSGFVGMGGAYPLVFRQQGANIHMSLRVSGSFPPNTLTTFGEPYPIRYHSSYDGLTRIAAIGTGGRVTGAYTGGSRAFSSEVRGGDITLTYLAGSGYWPAPHTDRSLQSM